jgi:hypothetical protein
VPPRAPRVGTAGVMAAGVRAAAAVGLVSGLALASVVAGSVLARADAVRQREWFLAAMHAPQAWKTAQGAGVTVAVLADGTSVGQADIAGSVTQGPSFVRSGRKPSGKVGTGLASLIVGHGHGAARGNGVLGVAPAATVLALTVTLSPGDPAWSRAAVTSRLPDAIAAGIMYAVRHGATVIELPADPGVSAGQPRTSSAAAMGGSPAERRAIAYAVSKNVVLVAPAGDNAQWGDAPNYPAAYPGVIAVGAVGKTLTVMQGSSDHSYVTVTAAGQDVVAAAPAGYQTMSGTWAASAIVAGVAALVRSQFPNLTAAQVRKALIAGTIARPHGGFASGRGYGIADALGALTDAATMSPPHAQPAMLGARPRSRPVLPAMPTAESLIAHDLIGDTIVSGGLFAVLLALILSYGAVARRRDRRAILLADRVQFAGVPPGEGPAIDPLLELFRPQHARPAAPRPRPPITPRYAPAPIAAGRTAARYGRPMLPPPGGQAFPTRPSPVGTAGPPTMPADSVFGESVFGGEPVFGGESGFRGDSVFGAETAARGGSGFSSASFVQRRPVSGAPPWEPAPMPTSELPWVAAPAASGGGPAGPRPSGTEPSGLPLGPGPAAPGPVTPGPVAPGPVTPGPVTPGPVTPGPVAPGPAAPGPSGTVPAPITPPVPAGPPEWIWDEPSWSSTRPHAVVGPGGQPGPDMVQAVGRDTGGRPIYVWNPPSDEVREPGPPWPDLPDPERPY